MLWPCQQMEMSSPCVNLCCPGLILGLWLNSLLLDILPPSVCSIFRRWWQKSSRREFSHRPWAWSLDNRDLQNTNCESLSQHVFTFFGTNLPIFWLLLQLRCEWWKHVSFMVLTDEKIPLYCREISPNTQLKYLHDMIFSHYEQMRHPYYTAFSCPLFKLTCDV